MITRKDVEGNTWRQDAEGAWHPWEEQAPEPQAPEAQAPEAPEGLSTGDQASGFASSMVQGATADWGDELLAAPMAGAAYLLGDAPEGEDFLQT